MLARETSPDPPPHIRHTIYYLLLPVCGGDTSLAERLVAEAMASEVPLSEIYQRQQDSATREQHDG